MDDNDGDSIRLTVPATPDAVRITRAGAMGLATRAGFSYQEVEEVRLAVGEAAALLTGDDTDREADNGATVAGHHDPDSADTLVVIYAFHPTGLSVELRLQSDEGRPSSDSRAQHPEATALAAADDARRTATLAVRPTGTEPSFQGISKLAAELLDANVDDWEVSTAARKVVLHKHRSEPDDED